MPYLLQLVSPNDSAKLRIIFIDANFPTFAFNLFGFYALRWPSDVNREATIFCELLHFLQQLDLFPFAIRSLLRLAEIFCPWHMSISEGCRSDDFHCHSQSSDHSVEDGDTWDYHTVFYTGNI